MNILDDLQRAEFPEVGKMRNPESRCRIAVGGRCHTRLISTGRADSFGNILQYADQIDPVTLKPVVMNSNRHVQLFYAGLLGLEGTAEPRAEWCRLMYKRTQDWMQRGMLSVRLQTSAVIVEDRLHKVPDGVLHNVDTPTNIFHARQLVQHRLETSPNFSELHWRAFQYLGKMCDQLKVDLQHVMDRDSVFIITQYIF